MAHAAAGPARSAVLVGALVAALVATSACGAVTEPAAPDLQQSAGTSTPAAAPSTPVVPGTSPATAVTPPSSAGSVAAPAAPVRVELPSIGAGSALVDLDLQDDGTLGVPADADLAGWFVGGGRPGAAGRPLVIAGHVDSATGPAVFYDLRDLQVGDAVEITTADGAAVSYVVDKIEQHPKDAFPTVQVFGAVAGEQLRLITCSGAYDPVTSYRDNLVVFASRR